MVLQDQRYPLSLLWMGQTEKVVCCDLRQFRGKPYLPIPLYFLRLLYHSLDNNNPDNGYIDNHSPDKDYPDNEDPYTDLLSYLELSPIFSCLLLLGWRKGENIFFSSQNDSRQDMFALGAAPLKKHNKGCDVTLHLVGVFMDFLILHKIINHDS